MKRLAPVCLCLIAVVVAPGVRSAGAEAGGFTRLVPADARIMAAATAFPGGGYNAENLLKPAAPSGYRADYASHGLGAKTFVDFGLDRKVAQNASI